MPSPPTSIGSVHEIAWSATPVAKWTDVVAICRSVGGPGCLSTAVRVADTGLEPAALPANRRYEQPDTRPEIAHGITAETVGNRWSVSGEINAGSIVIAAPHPEPPLTSY